jgi:hypothetical protein
MSTLAELKTSVLEDGTVDAAEVAQIREAIFDDGIVDREEADFLFEINDAVSGKENDAGWQTLFVEGISKHVLEDETSPGVIDNDEAAYLKEKIHGDGQVDDAEKALLSEIKDKATGDTPSELSFLFDMYLN